MNTGKSLGQAATRPCSSMKHPAGPNAQGRTHRSSDRRRGLGQVATTLKKYNHEGRRTPKGCPYYDFLEAPPTAGAVREPSLQRARHLPVIPVSVLTEEGGAAESIVNGFGCTQRSEPSYRQEDHQEKRQRRNQWIPAQGRNDGGFSRSMKRRVGRGASRSARLLRKGPFTYGPYENRGKGRGHKTRRTRGSAPTPSS